MLGYGKELRMIQDRRNYTAIYPLLQVSLGTYVQKYLTNRVVFLMNSTTRDRLTYELCGSERLMFLFEVSAIDGKLNRIFNCPVEISGELSDNNVVLRDAHHSLPPENVRALNNLMNGQKDNDSDYAHAWPDNRYESEG
jgi:hypothetical protein